MKILHSLKKERDKSNAINYWPIILTSILASQEIANINEKGTVNYMNKTFFSKDNTASDRNYQVLHSYLKPSMIGQRF